MPALSPLFLIFSNSSGDEGSEERLPLPPPFNRLPSGEEVDSVEAGRVPGQPGQNDGTDMAPSSAQGLLPIHVSSAELPILLVVAALVVSAVGLTFWSLGRRGFSTFFGSRGVLNARNRTDPYLPPPSVLPRSAHERIQDPKYLRGILEAERGSPSSGSKGGKNRKPS